jgi:hypothetical protein
LTFTRAFFSFYSAPPFSKSSSFFLAVEFEKAEFFSKRLTSSKFSSNTVSRFDSFLVSLNSSCALRYTTSPTCVIRSLTEASVPGAAVSSWLVSEATAALKERCCLSFFKLRRGLYSLSPGNCFLVGACSCYCICNIVCLGISIGVNTCFRVLMPVGNSYRSYWSPCDIFDLPWSCPRNLVSLRSPWPPPARGKSSGILYDLGKMARGGLFSMNL